MSLEDKYPRTLALRRQLAEAIQGKQAGTLTGTRLGLYELLWVDLYKELDALLSNAAVKEGIEVG